MSAVSPKLKVEFTTEAAFRSEYLSNIANGGVFIATETPLEARTPVVVVLELSYCGEHLELEGEVVHCIPREMAHAGASPGVAVQFTAPARDLRRQFEPFAGVLEGNERISRSGRRAAPRAPARVQVDLESESAGELCCRTRDISTSGVLVSVTDVVVPVSERVRLRIHHPASGETMRVGGTVVRQLVTDDGLVTALGIEFHVPEARHTEVSAFIADVQSTEHSRRLGDITGPIAELGIENLLQMFGLSSQQGTLTVTRGVEEGTIIFVSGQLRAARLGRLHGREALRQMLAWREGGFEFHAQTDEAEYEGEPMALEASILEALREMDEERGAAGRAGGEDLGFELDVDLADDLDLDLDAEMAGTGDESPAAAGDLDSEMRDRGAGPAARGRAGRKTEAKPARGAKRPKSARGTRKRGEAKSARSRSAARPKRRKKPASAPVMPDTVFTVDAAAADAGRSDLGKTEEAVLDLALVGMSVKRMLDVIPESEAEVQHALESLLERGLIRVP